MSDLKKIIWFALFLVSLWVYSRLDILFNWASVYKWQLSIGFGVLIVILIIANWSTLKEENDKSLVPEEITNAAKSTD